MKKKPDSCLGCDLYDKGVGFAPPSGPSHSPLLIVGEALGREEAKAGSPFVGPSGHFLDKALKRAGLDRTKVAVTNCISCRPPNDWLVNAPWEWSALAHCGMQHLDRAIERIKPEAILAVGVTAATELLGLPRKGFEINNWHGTVTRGKHGINVIPTYHPAFLMRGNQNLTGVFQFDLQIAQEASGGWIGEPATLGIDHPAEWLREACRTLEGHPETWVAVDVETVKKLKAGDEAEIETGTVDEVVRVNIGWHPDEGFTMPFSGQHREVFEWLMALPNPKILWNARYDIPLLRDAGVKIGGQVIDMMWAWHVLQSDLPRGLGFVAPFYSKYGAWKHLSSSDPAVYAAIDAVQTIRCAFGIARDLQAAGMWDVAFWRHKVVLQQRVLDPAEERGILVDPVELPRFKAELEEKTADVESRITPLIPREILPLHPKSGWKREPQTPKEVTYKRADGDLVVTYGPDEIVAQGGLWYVREPFNPDSPDHLRAYMSHHKHPMGKSPKAKTSKGSTNKKHLQNLSKKDPLYKLILEKREIGKVLGTYVRGTESRLKVDGRIHPEFAFHPSTMRLSCRNPNIQNVTQDRGEGFASGYRKCIVASPGKTLFEADFSAIEAVMVGWFAGDPDYIRLAKASIHAYLVGAEFGGKDGYPKVPPKEKLKGIPTAELKALLKPFKKHPAYDRKKRTVHGVSYGLTSNGMSKTYPEIFTSPSQAQREIDLLFALAPKLRDWQKATQLTAHRQGYLGGSSHPFNYRHWFWDVFQYEKRSGKWRLGEDAKRAVAYWPQSTAAGVIDEAAIRFTYTWEKETGEFPSPILALIHDSCFGEVEDERLRMCLTLLIAEMEKPILQLPCPPEWELGEYLTVGVEAKVGKNWAEMEEWK